MSARAEPLPPEPGASCPDGESTELAISERIFDILGSVRNRDVAPLGSAFPSPLLFPLPRLAQAMAAHLKRQDPLDTVEDLSPGNPALRRQIALRYLIAGINIPASDIVVTNGALEALNLCLQAVTRPGDTVIVEAPTFYGALQALERQGLKALEVPTHPRTGMDLDALESAIARHRPAACWLMTQFQNPLGSLMPDERKRQLVELLTRHDIPLIEDDVYGELYFGATRPVPPRPTTRRAWCCTVPHSPNAWRRATESAGPRRADTRSACGGSSCRPRCRRPARRRAPSRNSWNRAATTVTCAGCATRCRPCRPGWRRRWPMRFPPARA